MVYVGREISPTKRSIHDKQRNESSDGGWREESLWRAMTIRMFPNREVIDKIAFMEINISTLAMQLEVSPSSFLTAEHFPLLLRIMESESFYLPFDLSADLQTSWNVSFSLVKFHRENLCCSAQPKKWITIEKREELRSKIGWLSITSKF